jgi:outer membrane protein OmpA-like peptidoglycan-associated protein
MKGLGLSGLATLVALMAAPQVAAAETIKGMITARDGANMTVTAGDGTTTTITLTDGTEVVSTSGAFGLQTEDLEVTDLINGLPVKVETIRNRDEVDAAKVTFKASDLKTARQVEAGTAQVKAQAKAKASELEAQNTALRQRLSEANQYVEKAQTTVLFASGSAVISAEGKADLQQIATKAKAIKGYLVGVVGYADSTGDAAANQKLSERRAEAVIRYLQKYCGVMPYRVLSGAAMGEIEQVGNTETPEGMAQNRRVVVKVITNKGLEGL